MGSSKCKDVASLNTDRAFAILWVMQTLLPLMCARSSVMSSTCKSIDDRLSEALRSFGRSNNQLAYKESKLLFMDRFVILACV